jgi:hypothetical protein
MLAAHGELFRQWNVKAPNDQPPKKRRAQARFEAVRRIALGRKGRLEVIALH